MEVTQERSKLATVGAAAGFTALSPWPLSSGCQSNLSLIRVVVPQDEERGRRWKAKKRTQRSALLVRRGFTMLLAASKLAM